MELENYMNGAGYLCRILKKKGVKYVFGLFGDIQTDFAHAVRESSIHWIGVHNEKCGGFMADIYARVSGMPGIIFSTLGPGGTNLTSALANATQDRSPLIAISDQVPLKDFNKETHQYVDFEKAFGPNTGITKLTLVVKKVEDIGEVFEKAFVVAMKEPKGAVHISIPADIYGQKVNVKKESLGKASEDKKDQFISTNSTISYNDLLKKIQDRKSRGIVIVGGSVERALAREEFRSFIEKFDLPVLTTFRGKNAISSNHKQCLGTISRHLADTMGEVIAKASFVLTIGYDYNEGIKPSFWKGKEKNLFNIDLYDNRIKGIFDPPSLFGDIKKILNNLSKEKQPNYLNGFNHISLKKKFHSIVLRELDVNDPKLHPGRIIEAVNKLYGKDSIIVCDIGLNKYYSGLLLSATDHNKIIFSNGQSAMAFSSGAIGAKIADSKKNVVVLVGDGGFLMDAQEILTSKECGKPVIWIIFNNGGFGLVEQAQRKNSLKTHGVHFDNVFFVKLAYAFGIIGKRIKPGEDLLPILRKIKKLNKTAIIDVPVEYTPRRKAY